MPATVERIVGWVEDHGVIRELWLFGSRARGDYRPDSDVDLAVELKGGDAAFGLYIAIGDQWQRELAALVGLPVSLEAVDATNRPNDPMIVLWRRST